MKRSLCVVFLVVLITSAGFATEEARFMRYPTTNGDKIVFTYEDDLWSVSAAGGQATRLTTYPGVETFAKFSPDG